MEKYKNHFVKGVTGVLSAVLFAFIFTVLCRAEPEYVGWRETYDDYGNFVRTYTLKGDTDITTEFRCGLNFENIDFFQYVDYTNAFGSTKAGYCSCENPAVNQDEHYQNVILKSSTGQELFNDKFTDKDYLTGKPHSTYEYQINGPKWGKNVLLIIDFNLPSQTCAACHKPLVRKSSIGKIVLTDIRGRAYIPREYYAKPGDTVKIDPTYTGDVKQIMWGIRYEDEGDFTILSDKTDSDGMVISGAGSTILTLSNLPQNKSAIYIGVFVYDRDGLPAMGQDGLKTSSVSKIIIQKPDNTGDDNSNNNNNNNNGDDNTNGNPDSNGTPGSPDSNGNPGNPSSNGNPSDSGTPDNSDSSVNDSPNGGPNSSLDSSLNSSTSYVNQGSPASGSPESKLNDYKDTTKTEYVKGTPVKSSASSSSTSKKQIDNAENSGSASSSKKQSSSYVPRNLTESDKEDLFNKIRNNSNEYITNKETAEKNMDSNAADNENGKIKLNTLDGTDDSLYENAELEEAYDYAPDRGKRGVLFYALVISAVVLLILILMFFLFFGVIILAPCENDMLKAGGESGIRIPAGIRVLTVKDRTWALNFGELLSKHDVLDVRLGILFAYVYEGEELKILTKFKGEKRKEIASERIKREFSVGSRRGKI